MNTPAPRLLALLALLLTTLPAQAQSWQTIHLSRNGSSGEAVAVDATGNTYVTGQFGNTVTFGAFTLTSAGSSDVFLVKYSPEGSVLWARNGGGSIQDHSSGVAVDADGNAYVTGNFWGTAVFGSFGLPSSPYGSVFLVKYSPDGDVRWAHSAGGWYYDYGHGVAVDAAGNAYVTGFFYGPVTFGPFTLTSAGADVFVVKYSPDGDVLWAHSGGGSLVDTGRGVAVDAAGNAYVTGSFQGTATFGAFTLTSAGSTDVFVVKYAPDGEVLWARSGGGPNFERGYGVAVDAQGNTYITGYFREMATFGSFTLTSAGADDHDVFVVKYSPDGDVLRAHSGGGSSYEVPQGIAVDAAGNAYVTGNFIGTTTFGGFTLTSAGHDDFFLVKYSAAGDVLWALRGGGTRDDGGHGVAVDAAGNAYVAGVIRGTVAFGTCTLTAGSNGDTFLARVGALPVVAVTATPASPPVGIPPGGGTFSFAVTLTNPTSEAQTFEAWTAVTGQVSRDLVLGPKTVTLSPGATVTQTVTQVVPPYAPPGTYTYHVHAGIAPCGGAAGDSFTFEKVAGALAAPPLEADAGAGWATSGWDEAAAPDAPLASALLPDGYALSAPHPNPSDGRTQLSLAVAEAQRVTAAVYDGLGRRVAVLLDGATEAGQHVVVFDGSSLPAGVYLVRVTGEVFAVSRRVTLVR